MTSSFSAKDLQRRPSMPKQRSTDEYEPSSRGTGCEEVVKKRPKLNFQSFSFTLSVGEVQILVSHPNCVSSTASDFCSISEVGFSFLPQSNICPTSSHGRFTKGMNLAQEPRLYAQLNTFSIVESCCWAPCDRLIRYGTLEDIDNAIRAGEISPYVVDRHSGVNLCFYVRFLYFSGNVSFLMLHPSYSLQHYAVE
jgi:hypothetical protein